MIQAIRDYHDLLGQDILELMVQKETSEQDARRYQDQAVEAHPQQRQRIHMEQTIFGGFDQGNDLQAAFFERENHIKTACELELSNFRHGSIRQLLMKDDGQFNDPL